MIICNNNENKKRAVNGSPSVFDEIMLNYIICVIYVCGGIPSEDLTVPKTDYFCLGTSYGGYRRRQKKFLMKNNIIEMIISQ